MKSADIALNIQSCLSQAPEEDSRRILRPTLFVGELLRIPRESRFLRVLSGTAWISVTGTDVVVPKGDSIKLIGTRNPALVSALGIAPLLLEIW